jgi:antitoxin YefM
LAGFPPARICALPGRTMNLGQPQYGDTSTKIKSKNLYKSYKTYTLYKWYEYVKIEPRGIYKMLIYQNASDARKYWSEYIDQAIREKPVFLKRTRDHVALLNIEMLQETLLLYEFNVKLFNEDDGSITASLEEIDLIENAGTEDEVLDMLAKSILEYSEDYYNDLSYWHSAPNRKKHLPYVMKALILNDFNHIRKIIKINK